MRDDADLYPIGRAGGLSILPTVFHRTTAELAVIARL